VALLNAARLARGQAPLGFLNPWLYGTAAACGGLTDVQRGRSTGCMPRLITSTTTTNTTTDGGNSNSTSSGSGSSVVVRSIVGVPGAGWNATAGWDAVTGLGTPVFPRLLELI
jgi:tripeptidyl-peptidase-1